VETWGNTIPRSEDAFTGGSQTARAAAPTWLRPASSGPLIGDLSATRKGDRRNSVLFTGLISDPTGTYAARVTAAAFFDLDGCLVDSRPAIAAAMNHALRQLGLHEQPESELHQLIGPPLLSSFQRLLPAAGGHATQAREAVEAYRSVYPELSRALTTAVPGIPRVLAALYGHATLMVVTSKPHAFARPILESLALDRVFEAVFGPELDALTEPKSVQLAAAVAAADVPPAEAVMIGDRRHDIEAARGIGTKSIGVTWGIGDRRELVAAGADMTLDRPEQLLEALADA
jgi:phosphoglycolate phosphatase